MKTEEATVEKEMQSGQVAGDSGSKWDNLLPLRYAADIVDPDRIQKRVMARIGSGRRIAGVEIDPAYFQVGNPATDEGLVPARPESPVEDRLVLRENAKSEEESRHAEPARESMLFGRNSGKRWKNWDSRWTTQGRMSAASAMWTAMTWYFTWVMINW